MSGKAQGQPRPGVNVQMTRVVDRAGGMTNLVLNTHVPAHGNDAPSEQAIDDMVKRLHGVMQREVNRNVDAEKKRAAAERAQFEKAGHNQVQHPPALATPEGLPRAPNGDARAEE